MKKYLLLPIILVISYVSVHVINWSYDGFLTGWQCIDLSIRISFVGCVAAVIIIIYKYKNRKGGGIISAIRNRVWPIIVSIPLFAICAYYAYGLRDIASGIVYGENGEVVIMAKEIASFYFLVIYRVVIVGCALTMSIGCLLISYFYFRYNIDKVANAPNQSLKGRM